MHDHIAVLLLAAGAATRMRGRDKLLEEVAGQPLLARMIARAQATGYEVLVTLPDLAHPRALLAKDTHRVPVPDAAEGMAASIRAGVRALPEHIAGVMILPADMPELTTADLRNMGEAFEASGSDPEGAICRATGQDQAGHTVPGHPVLFPRRCFDALKQLSGDAGARHVLNGEQLRSVALPAAHALTDLDTPEAWDAWRQQHDRR